MQGDPLYETFSAKDFLLDDFFIRWIKHPDEETVNFWESWLKAHPQKAAEIKEAILLLQQLQFQQDAMAKESQDRIWQELRQAHCAQQKTPTYKVVKLPRVRSLNYAYKVAAVLLIMVLVGMLYFRWQQHRTIEYTTNYGETRTIVLPDSSVVTLNAHSVIRYPRNWNEQSAREVELEGEAFFSVVHKKSNQCFVVHTDELKLEVLGTSFNVNNRRGRVQVVLQTGKVKLSLPPAENKRQTATGEKDILMQPGELVEFSEQESRVTKKKINTAIYTSWKDNKLLFDNTALREVFQLIRDNYGIEVVLYDSQLNNKVFTGSAPANDLDILISKLATIYDLQVRKGKGKIVLEPRVH